MIFSNKLYTVNWDILASGYFGSFLSKCGFLIFGAFQKMIVLFYFQMVRKKLMLVTNVFFYRRPPVSYQKFV
jgi:hypothetical protein